MSQSFRPLYDFLIDTFNEGELRRFVAMYYSDLRDGLPSRGSRADVTTRVVEALIRNKVVDEALFAALLEMRPRLAGAIDELRRKLAAPGGEAAQPRVTRGGAAQQPGLSGEDKRLDVMFVAANPKSMSELKLREEARGIEDKLRGTPGERSIDIRYSWRADADSLMDALYQGVPDVLHFAGHGGRNGAMLLEAAGGSSQPVQPDALAALLGARPRRPRVIVLNACHSVVMARALLPLVDAVIGMRDEVADVAARKFAVEFYRAVGHERPIREAFDLARAALRVHSMSDDLLQLDVRGVDARTYRLV